MSLSQIRSNAIKVLIISAAFFAPELAAAQPSPSTQSQASSVTPQTPKVGIPLHEIPKTADSSAATPSPKTPEVISIPPSAVEGLPPALQALEAQNQSRPRVEAATAFAAPAGGSTSVFCQIIGADTEDELVGLGSAWAETAVLVNEKGEEAASLVTPPQSQIDLSSQTALHIELRNLQRSLRAGLFFPLTFYFKSGLSTRVMVKIIEADSPTTQP